MLKLVADKDVTPHEIAARVAKTTAHLNAERLVIELRAERDAARDELNSAIAARDRGNLEHDAYLVNGIQVLDQKLRRAEEPLKKARADLASHAAEHGKRVDGALAGKRRDAADRIAQAQEVIRQELAILEDIFDATTRAGGTTTAVCGFFDMVGISEFVRRYRSQK